VSSFAIAITICIICQLLIVCGQILLKHAMTEPTDVRPAVLYTRVRNFMLAILCLTVWFFLWLGLMRRWDLSKLFPFEGLNPGMIAIAAWLILKERLPLRAWLGLVLVCAGIALVARS
jgi:drug/metabolite transporter (DMT)-like permease